MFQGVKDKGPVKIEPTTCILLLIILNHNFQMYQSVKFTTVIKLSLENNISFSSTTISIILHTDKNSWNKHCLNFSSSSFYTLVVGNNSHTFCIDDSAQLNYCDDCNPHTIMHASCLLFQGSD